MDLRIKYLTTNVDDIMEDMNHYHTNNEKINFLLDTKSYLATIATKLESEIVLPLDYYEEKIKLIDCKDDPVMFLINSMSESIKEIADNRNKTDFNDTNYHTYQLLKEQLALMSKTIRKNILFIDEQVEILEKKIKNSSERVVLDPIKETDNDVFGSLTPDKILEELEKLEFEEQNPFIKKVLRDIEIKYGKDYRTAPMQIRILQTSLIGKQMINRGLESMFGTTNTKGTTEQLIHPLFHFEIDDIKRYGNTLPEEERYRYYLRVLTEIERILNSFLDTGIRNYSDDIRLNGLEEFKESYKYFLNDDKCPELNEIVEKRVSEINDHTSEEEYRKAFGAIDTDMYEEGGRVQKCKELINYEIEYLEKILGKTNIIKEKSIDSNNEGNAEKERWAGTKTEFARKIAEEYQTDKGKNYKSLKNACEQIFQKYEFDDKKFTAQRCYDLARKV